MMIGLGEVYLGGCHEGESSEPMPALTLGQKRTQFPAGGKGVERLNAWGRGRDNSGQWHENGGK